MPRSLPPSLPRLGLILLIPLLLWAIPCHAAFSKDKSVTKSYGLAQGRYHILEFSPTLAKDRQNWLLCAKAFGRAYQLDPNHPSAPNTLRSQGDIYFQMYKKFGDQDDLNKALSFYDDIVTLFPHHILADATLFQTAMIQAQELKDVNGATLSLAKLIAVYPHGDMTKQAIAELKRLKPPIPQQALAPAAKVSSQPNTRSKIKPTPEKVQTKTRPARIVSLRHWSTESYTRVVIETSVPVPYKGHLLKGNGSISKRLYVDLDQCVIGRDMQQPIPIKDGLLQQMRGAQFNPNTVRVVLDTLSIDNYKIFTMDNPFRIIVDVKGTTCTQAKSPSPNQNKTKAQQTVKGHPTSLPPPPPLSPPLAPRCKNPSLAQQLGLGIKRVVLDPGHGGKDPGAIGFGGLREKDIVLTVAKKVAHDISTRMGIEVVLTRKTDVFIPLEERTAIANTKGGDLFISIHANSAPSNQAHGIETYYLDLAGTEEDRGLAAAENASSSRQISDLQNILKSLMQNSKKDESARLAGTVQNSLVSGLVKQYPDVMNHGVKTAPFIVLIGAQMPSILTEIAFISNPMEAQRLQNDSYLEALANDITDGVVKYASSLTMAARNNDFGFQMLNVGLRMNRSIKIKDLSLGISLLLLLVLAGCSREPATTYQGYAEGEYIAVSSSVGGTLARLAVRRGDEIKAGETLAVLEHELESTMVAEAEQGLLQAENRLTDLGKGQRPAELSAIAAQLEKARITLGQAQRELARRQQLYREKTIAFETLDQAKTLKEQAEAQVAEFSARLATARLGGREDAIKAAIAEVAAAKERVAQARWRLDQKTLTAPKAGLVSDTYYVEGEFLAPALPVLSLLPPENITIRFFVPEPVVGKLTIGQKIGVGFDGAVKPLSATISYISTRAEFTPPVIYSRNTRSKLVFMVEAHPLVAEATRFHPGQPVDVALEPVHE